MIKIWRGRIKQQSKVKIRMSRKMEENTEKRQRKVAL